jgi:NADH:ubiquinone oxidoreductase subunit F (NADH-binding)
MERILERIMHGEGTEEDIAVLNSVAKQMQGKCLCALGEFAVSPVLSTIAHFLDEYKAKINQPEAEVAA